MNAPWTPDPIDTLCRVAKNIARDKGAIFGTNTIARDQLLAAARDLSQGAERDLFDALIDFTRLDLAPTDHGTHDRMNSVRDAFEKAAEVIAEAMQEAEDNAYGAIEGAA